jgi:hypothetical protein
MTADEFLLTGQELASTIEALWDAINARLRRTVDPEPADRYWQELDWATVQEIIDSMTQAYTKLVMVFRELYGDQAHPRFLKEFGLRDYHWGLLTEVTKADSWAELKASLD